MTAADVRRKVKLLALELGRSPTKVELETHRIWFQGMYGYKTVSALLRDCGLPTFDASAKRSWTPDPQVMRRQIAEGDTLARRKLILWNAQHRREQVGNELPMGKGWMD